MQDTITLFRVRQPSIVIFGTGTFAEVVAGYFGDDVAAFTVDREYMRADTFLGRPVIPLEELPDYYLPGDGEQAGECEVFVAVTQQNGHRTLLLEKAAEINMMGYELASLVSPTAFVGPHVYIGDGVLVSPHAIVECGAHLDYGTIVRSGAYVGHHCRLHPGVYVAPRAVVAGHCKVNAGAFIGNNATLRDRLTIGQGAVVGAGACVLRDVKPYEVYKALEARLLSVDGREVDI